MRRGLRVVSRIEPEAGGFGYERGACFRPVAALFFMPSPTVRSRPSSMGS